MKRLRPFFKYFGGKWRMAPKFPYPIHKEIVEPFAGAAGYSLLYPYLKVTLCDLDPKICGIWDYLIRVSEKEILDLPSVVNHVDEVKSCEEARWLIGFWMDSGASKPATFPRNWMRLGGQPGCFWGDIVKRMMSSQLRYIRHWRIINGSYLNLQNRVATWFVDPPYIDKGKSYHFNSIDYTRLASWCRSRLGQVMVCEQYGADWLPFKRFMSIKAGGGSGRDPISREVIWTDGGPLPMAANLELPEL